MDKLGSASGGPSDEEFEKEMMRQMEQMRLRMMKEKQNVQKAASKKEGDVSNFHHVIMIIVRLTSKRCRGCFKIAMLFPRLNYMLTSEGA